ncbi:uncharacterized protein LOC119083458 [Bradysia coprophila]|uniref:uncharacterized protein LOC119083458 n=1 Tax=Bradysia coprophila TaxID=38358 RepID=UPI00187D8964|nr:uncharacterized protein LOC119083458 [Bradysia coprophila]
MKRRSNKVPDAKYCIEYDDVTGRYTTFDTEEQYLTYKKKRVEELCGIELDDGSILSKFFYEPYTNTPIPKTAKEADVLLRKFQLKCDNAKKDAVKMKAAGTSSVWNENSVETEIVGASTGKAQSYNENSESDRISVDGSECTFPGRTDAFCVHSNEPDYRDTCTIITGSMSVVGASICSTTSNDLPIKGTGNQREVKAENGGSDNEAVQSKSILVRSYNAHPHRQKPNLKAKKKTKVSFLNLRAPWPGYPFVDQYGKLVRPIMSEAERNAFRQISQPSDPNPADGSVYEEDPSEANSNAASGIIETIIPSDRNEQSNWAGPCRSEENDNISLADNVEVGIPAATSSLVQATVWQPKECAFTFMDELNFQSTHGIEMDTTNGTNSTHGVDNHFLGPLSKNESVNVDDTVNCSAISDNQPAQPDLIMLDAEQSAVPVPLTIVDTNFTFTFTDDDCQIAGPTLHIVNDIREHTTPESTVALEAFLDEDEHLFANFLNIPDATIGESYATHSTECMETDPAKINSTQNVSVDGNSFFDDQDDHLFTAFEENFF